MLRGFPIPGFEIKFSESGKPEEWHQVLKTGSFSDKRYRKFTIDRKYLSSLKENFTKNVRKIDLAVDYKHDSDSVAAGWVEDVKLEENGKQAALFIKVKWTPAGEKKLAEKEFRYLSADISDDYEDNETGKKHGPTLLGAGLTNRPVIKGMQPVVQLSEGDVMDLKEAQEKIETLEKQLAEAKQSTEVKDLQKKLSEQSEQIKKFQEEKDAAEKAQKLAEKKAEFQKLLSEKKACPAQEEAFLKGDMVEFMKNAQPLPSTAAAGSGKEGGGASGTPDEQIKKLAESKMIDNKGMTFAEAINKVREEKPELWKQRYA